MGRREVQQARLEQRRYRLLRVELTEYRDQLIAKHGRVAGRHTDGKAVADAIERMLARAAGLGGPDDG